MKSLNRSTLLACLVLVTTVLGACGGGAESEEPQATAEAETDASSSAEPASDPEDACPPEAEIVAIVGQPVASRSEGSHCFYETADFTASVTIMRISPSQADQVEGEMRAAAGPYGAEVGTIDVGERGHAWGSPGYGQGYAVSGDRGWMADVSVNSGDEGSQRDAVVRILERMIG